MIHEKDKTPILLEQVTPWFCTLAFPSVESKEWFWVSFVKCLKDAEKEEVPHSWSCQHGCPGTQVTAVVHGKRRKILFQLTAFSASAGSDRPGRAITFPVSQEKEGNGGAEPLCDLLLTETWSLEVFLVLCRYSGLWWATCALQLQIDTELMLFVLFLA